jgi:signal transduction histidine kinase
MERDRTGRGLLDLLVDVVPAAVLMALAGVGMATSPENYAEPRTVSAVLLIGAAAALVVRRHKPATAAVVAAALVSTYLLGLSEDLTRQPPFEPFLVMVVAFFALGLHGEGRPRVFGAALAGSALVAAQTSMILAGRPLGEALPSLLFWACAAAVGAVVGRYHHAARSAARAAEDLSRRREADVDEAVGAERARIARELHDVVAHGLSVIVIQASVEARLHRERDPAVAETLGTIEAAGRSALEDLRRLLGLLRAQPNEASALAPLPTVADLDATVARLRSGGHDVSLTVTGDPRDLPPGVGLSAYRIAQEALTNAVKHAPGSQVRVQVGYDDDGVVVSVEDDGPHVGTPASGGLSGGHGLLGMRERVRLYSGRLEAGPVEAGGFAVRALLPTRAEGA